MSKAIVIHKYGGPEVLKWEEFDPGDPGPNEVRIRHTAIGLNFRDIYHREGGHKAPGDNFPMIIGGDGAGVVEAVGANVSMFNIGQRVAYGNGPMGSYSQVRIFPVSHLFALPDQISDKTAAAMLVKGFTAYSLIYRAFPIHSRETILIHAVAGGTGLIMCQLAKLRGATVIGTVSTEEKAAVARQFGCDHVILYTHEDVAVRVREITCGKGVSVVFDSIGKTTLEGSIDSLRVGGILIVYGEASGDLPKLDSLMLMDKGSLFFSRVKVRHYFPDRAEMERIARELFDFVSHGKIKIEVSKSYHLHDAAEAHRDFQSKRTYGSVIYSP